MEIGLLDLEKAWLLKMLEGENVTDNTPIVDLMRAFYIKSITSPASGNGNVPDNVIMNATLIKKHNNIGGNNVLCEVPTGKLLVPIDLRLSARDGMFYVNNRTDIELYDGTTIKANGNSYPITHPSNASSVSLFFDRDNLFSDTPLISAIFETFSTNFTVKVSANFSNSPIDIAISLQYILKDEA